VLPLVAFAVMQEHEPSSLLYHRVTISSKMVGTPALRSQLKYYRI
jgi:hypothetical protein